MGATTGGERALAGEVRAADAEGMTESEHESEDSAEEGVGGRDNAAEAPWRGRQEGVAGVSEVVAQAMRYAGCPNRRSLGFKRSAKRQN